MKHYEALIITAIDQAAPVAGATNAAAQKGSFEEILGKHDGKILGRNDLGKRQLGYAIKKSKEGFVTSFEFELPPENVEKLNRTLQLSDQVSKFMITVKTVVKPPKVKKRSPRRASLATAPKKVRQ